MVQELTQLREFMGQPESGLAVIYGRHRVGKTRLIAELLEGTPVLSFEGLEERPTRDQINHFLFQLQPYVESLKFRGKRPSTWKEALLLLLQALKASPRPVVLDEFQWMANYRHELVSDLKYVWENFLAKLPGQKLILCGSIYKATEYLALEQRSRIKHEYVDGEIYGMSGASRRHNLLAGNLFGLAWQAAAGSACHVFGSDMKVHVPVRNSFYYPDVSASCDLGDADDRYLTTPCAIIEVTSLSTASVDRRAKRLSYATLQSLHEYVIVDQDYMRIDVYPGAGSPWVSKTLDQPNDVLELSCLRLRLILADIYAGVELPAPGVRESECPAAFTIPSRKAASCL